MLSSSDGDGELDPFHTHCGPNVSWWGTAPKAFQTVKVWRNFCQRYNLWTWLQFLFCRKLVILLMLDISRDRDEYSIVLLYQLVYPIIGSNENGISTASASQPILSKNRLVFIGRILCAVPKTWLWWRGWQKVITTL